MKYGKVSDFCRHLLVQAVDQEVLTQVCHWLRQGQSCWLATVVATYGSSPRPIGSLFTCNKDALVVGSLSGGCVEEDLVDKLVNGEVAFDKPYFMRYGKTEEEATKFGLPCGGQLDIVVEPLNAQNHTKDIYSQINSVLNQRRSVRRTVRLDTGDTSLVETATYSPLVYEAESNLLEQTYGPRRQLFVIGTNMVAQYVAEFAQKLDFRVTVIDTDQTNIDSFPVPGVERVCDLPDEVVQRQANDQSSAIVALSHDPRLDDMALIGAFETPAFYIGAMGSQRTSASRRDRLRDLGVSEQELARLHAPIGFNIGSKTPPEIAISIMAEITQTQYNKT
ncbi:MAG: XdhC family protein [Gammaproteobacteria bacterium]|nr:XdhC family protein [Gammaproteobacteria bacterium]